MKKWNNPELLSLGVENTFEDSCSCGAQLFKSEEGDSDNNGNQHYCHVDKIAHANNCVSWQNSDHRKDEQCSGPHWSYAHVSKCCCGQKALQGQS